MTREETKQFLKICKEICRGTLPLNENLDVMQAFADGAVIEVESNHGEWKAITEASFTFKRGTYRIASEDIAYRPFDLLSISRVSGTLIRSSRGGPKWVIQAWNEKSVVLSMQNSCNAPMFFSYEDLLKHFRFENGEPCGIKKA